MENLNAEQVKKGLECCCMQELTHDENCPECPYTDLYPNCFEYLGKNALALINSQEQRIKELESENGKITINMNVYGLTAKRLGEENERLKESNLVFAHGVEKVAANYYNLGCTDTVRKMQERLHERFHDRVAYTRSYVHDTIDQIANEMLEGNENEM